MTMQVLVRLGSEAAKLSPLRRREWEHGMIAADASHAWEGMMIARARGFDTKIVRMGDVFVEPNPEIFVTAR